MRGRDGLFGHFFSRLSFHFSFSLSVRDGPILTKILSQRQRAVKHKTTNQTVPGRPTYLAWSRQGPTALAVGAGGSCLKIFSLVYHFSFFLPLSGWVG